MKELFLKKSYCIPFVLSLLMVFVMTGLSGLLDEKEIIFPEITALTIGAWFAPKQSWQVSKIRLPLLITIFAVIGVLFVRYVPIADEFKIITAFVLCSIGMLISKTSFAPMISAAVLPILMGTTSWIYPISAAVMAITVALTRLILEKTDVKETHNFTPVDYNYKKEISILLQRVVIVSVLCLFAIKSGHRFLIAPPLIVGFTELSAIKTKARSKSLKILFVTAFSAFIGAGARFLFCEIFNLPLFCAAAVGVALVLIFSKMLGTYFPPSGAIAVLALIIPFERLGFYPFEVTIGFAVMTAAALLMSKEKLYRT